MIGYCDLFPRFLEYVIGYCDLFPKFLEYLVWFWCVGIGIERKENPETENSFCMKNRGDHHGFFCVLGLC